MQDHIDRIHNKIQLILKHVAALEKENDQQKKDIQRLRQLKEAHETQVKNLLQQNYILKAATNQMSEADKAALEQSINKYVRDIDKCISLLSE
jgi:hypothetical protein